MKRTLALILCALLLLAFAGCAAGPSESVPEKPRTDTQTPETSDKTGETTIGETETPEHPPKKTDYNVSAGSETYRGFLMDNILHSDVGDIHFHLYIPESYDKSEPYALYLSLPGYEGLYFQGVGTNIRAEDFVFEAQKYNDKMIIAAPQLSDWGNSSAEQTIALTEYLLDAYAIDRGKVYINGYSGGGETLSLVLTKRPELFTAALHVASVWDGELAPLVQARTPVSFVIGESDEYYGSARISRTYEELCSLYRAEGLTEEEIGALAVLDVKDRAWFGGGNQHGGIGRVSQDEAVMRWLFGR